MHPRKPRKVRGRPLSKTFSTSLSSTSRCSQLSIRSCSRGWLVKLIRIGTYTNQARMWTRSILSTARNAFQGRAAHVEAVITLGLVALYVPACSSLCSCKSPLSWSLALTSSGFYKNKNSSIIGNRIQPELECLITPFI